MDEEVKEQLVDASDPCHLIVGRSGSVGARFVDPDYAADLA